MRILIAEDDALSRRVLEDTLGKIGYDLVVTTDGLQAWEALRQEDAPPLAVLDWMMPGMDGLQICRKVREAASPAPTYLIIVTTRERKEDIVTGLDAGANDYVTKPFDRGELQARVRVGTRVVELQQSLADRVRELQEALAHVKQLQGMLPICCYCKKIRNDQKYWQKVEEYLSEHAEVTFSHGICPDCWETVVKPEWGVDLPYDEPA